MPLNGRAAALRALYRYRKGARTEEALDSVLGGESIDSRDAALATRIFYGVVQNMMLLDYTINTCSSVPTAKMEPQVLDILRLSVYQLAFMSKIPVSAAVSEGVALTKKHANPRAAGLVNAVLRKLSQNPGTLPEPDFPNACERLSVKYSHPLWLVKALGERCDQVSLEALLQADNAEAPMTAMVNTLKTETDALLASLRAEGADAARYPVLPDCVTLSGVGGLERLKAYKEGLFYIQDAAAALAVDAAAPAPGMFVLDACAAPGGKSFATALRMKNTGKILSCDLQEKKLARIKDGAARLGISIIETRTMDASVPDESLFEKADIVIADVPCSGFGVIRKKPEIRYKREEDIAGLPELQRNIIGNLSRYVRPGGVLLYSTCTLLSRENEDIIAAFLKEHTDFAPEPFALPIPGEDAADGMATLWPHRTGTDGFFICRLRRHL